MANSPDGKLNSEKIRPSPPIAETPEELKLLARNTDEVGFFDLQKQITDMKSKGIDATAYEVDLQSKLAVPIISPLMVLLGHSVCAKKTRQRGTGTQFWYSHDHWLSAIGYSRLSVSRSAIAEHYCLDRRLASQRHLHLDRSILFHGRRMNRVPTRLLWQRLRPTMLLITTDLAQFGRSDVGGYSLCSSREKPGG